MLGEKSPSIHSGSGRLRSGALAWVAGALLAVSLGAPDAARGQDGSGGLTGGDAAPAAAEAPPVPPVADQILRVHTIERPPFVIAGPNGALSGFSIDLWTEIVADLAATSDLVGETDFILETRFPDMLDAVREGRADAAAANISITSEREAVMDFSQPIYNSGLQILVRSDAVNVSLWRTLSASGAIWAIGAALAALLAAAHLFWWFERRRGGQVRQPYLSGVWDGLWWALMAFTTGGGDRPLAPAARALAMLWVVLGVVSVSSLTAGITTFLTINQLAGDIRSYRDLEGRRIGIPVGTTIETFARDAGLAYTPYSDLRAAFDALAAGEIDATIGDAPVVKHYALGAGAGVARVAGPVFRPDMLGIAFPSGSPLRDPANRALLRLIESGRHAELRRRYFGADD